MIRPFLVPLVASLAAVSPVATAAPAPAASPIVSHPDKLTFQPLAYAAPNRDKHRHALSNGVTVFVIEDRALPLVTVGFTCRGGSYLEPEGKWGLAAMTADQMRSGGAGDLDADAFDARADFLAINLDTGSGGRESSATMNCLSKDMGAALDLTFTMLRSPRFQPDRIDLYKTQLKQQLERRNDSTTDIEQREWRRLMYGADHFESRQPTVASIGSITRDDLVAFHARMWSPANLIVTVTGDVATADALAALEKRFAGWAVGEAVPPVPKPTHVPPVGVFVVNKDDVNQTRVSAGHLSTTWDDPRKPAIEVMNEILGGGGFASRILKRVRSDEGLAYSAGSGIGFGREYPSSLRVAFQSKNKSVAQALDLALGEVARIRTEPVTASELDIAKSSIIESFPQRFSSARAKAGTFVDDELAGRPADYWEKYRPGIQAVTAANVMEAASSLLKPEAMAILVVGKVDEVLAGDPDKPDHALARTAARTGIMQIPLPEPGNLVYPGAPTVVVPPASAPQPEKVTAE